MSFKVVMIFKPGGEMESTVEGIEGPSCEEKTRFLDRIGRVKDHRRTPDYYAHVSEHSVSEVAHVGTGNGSTDEGGNHGSPW